MSGLDNPGATTSSITHVVMGTIFSLSLPNLFIIHGISRILLIKSIDEEKGGLPNEEITFHFWFTLWNSGFHIVDAIALPFVRP